MADAYFEASIDTEGVEIAIPIILGIDAVRMQILKEQLYFLIISA